MAKTEFQERIEKQVQFIKELYEKQAKAKNVVEQAIVRGLITKEEWDNRLQFYMQDRDSEYAIIHLITHAMHGKKNPFITSCEIILKNREYLERLCRVKIYSLKGFFSAYADGKV